MAGKDKVVTDTQNSNELEQKTSYFAPLEHVVLFVVTVGRSRRFDRNGRGVRVPLR